MTNIGSINGVIGAAPVGDAATDARQAALGTIGEIGHRILSWVAALGGDGSAAQDWADSAGEASDFMPDLTELARGGDIYRLGELTRSLAAQFGATPAREGELGRALESFTREAVIQLAGLSGASADRQLAGIREALAAGGEAASANGVEGLTQRLDAAAALLAEQNGR